MDRNERQAPYPVTPADGDRLEMAVQPHEGEPLEGEIIDINIRGAEARLPASALLPILSRASITFRSPRLAQPVSTEAKVVSRTDAGDFRRYRFEFLRPEELEQRLSAKVLQLFNRRVSFRVKPDPAQPIEATVEVGEAASAAAGRSASESPGWKIAGRVHDISATGVGFLSPPDADEKLAAVEVVEVSFLLPGDREPLHLVASIRNRRVADEAVLYGLELDPRLSRGFVPQQDRIVKYVMDRQRELLKSEKRRSSER